MRFYIVDCFAENRYEGNPLAVLRYILTGIF